MTPKREEKALECKLECGQINSGDTINLEDVKRLVKDFAESLGSDTPDRASAEADRKLLAQLLEILGKHCRETGKSEGAVEALNRIIDERKCALDGIARTVADLKARGITFGSPLIAELARLYLPHLRDRLDPSGSEDRADRGPRRRQGSRTPEGRRGK